MSEHVTSFNVYRPVMNISKRMLGAIMDVCVAEKVQAPEISGGELQAVLLGPEHVRLMHKGLATPPGLLTVQNLVSHVFDYLPPSADDTIHVPTLPFVRNCQQSGQKALAVGTNDPVSTVERSVAAALVRQFHMDPSMPWPWGAHESGKGVELGSFKADDNEAAVAAFEELLTNNPDLLPGELELGPVEIDVVT